MSHRSIPFSERTRWSPPDDATAAVTADMLDLTVANPTAVGFDVDEATLLAPLNSREALVYDPDPRGLFSARESVVRYYADHGAVIEPAQILLTTSTSEGYSYLFRLLCDPGDEVLVPQPSYPLFDLLAGLESVQLRHYPLFYDHGWWIDTDRLLAAITPRTRALLLVHPNNPTGHFTSDAEREQVEAICAEQGIALIVDEVFLDFPLNTAVHRSFAQGPHPVLTFVLSGMSKIAGLPQMKAGWIIALGPAELQAEALYRLEIIADTYLSMNMPVQLALPHWLANRDRFQQQLLKRVMRNLEIAQTIAPDHIEPLHLEGGWCAILRLSPWLKDETGPVRLLAAAGVTVHPGSFYGLHEPNRIVVSLITPETIFHEGLEQVVTVLQDQTA